MLTKKPGSILQTIVFQISLGQVLLTHEPEASTCCCIIVIWQNVISYQYYCCYVIIIAVIIIIIIIIILLILFDFFFFFINADWYLNTEVLWALWHMLSGLTRVQMSTLGQYEQHEDDFKERW